MAPSATMILDFSFSRSSAARVDEAVRVAVMLGYKYSKRVSEGLDFAYYSAFFSLSDSRISPEPVRRKVTGCPGCGLQAPCRAALIDADFEVAGTAGYAKMSPGGTSPKVAP